MKYITIILLFVSLLLFGQDYKYKQGNLTTNLIVGNVCCIADIQFKRMSDSIVPITADTVAPVDSKWRNYELDDVWGTSLWNDSYWENHTKYAYTDNIYRKDNDSIIDLMLFSDTVNHPVMTKFNATSIKSDLPMATYFVLNFQGAVNVVIYEDNGTIKIKKYAGGVDTSFNIAEQRFDPSTGKLFLRLDKMPKYKRCTNKTCSSFLIVNGYNFKIHIKPYDLGGFAYVQTMVNDSENDSTIDFALFPDTIYHPRLTWNNPVNWWSDNSFAVYTRLIIQGKNVQLGIQLNEQGVFVVKSSNTEDRTPLQIVEQSFDSIYGRVFIRFNKKIKEQKTDTLWLPTKLEYKVMYNYKQYRPSNKIIPLINFSPGYYCVMVRFDGRTFKNMIYLFPQHYINIKAE